MPCLLLLLCLKLLLLLLLSLLLLHLQLLLRLLLGLELPLPLLHLCLCLYLCLCCLSRRAGPPLLHQGLLSLQSLDAQRHAVFGAGVDAGGAGGRLGREGGDEGWRSTRMGLDGRRGRWTDGLLLTLLLLTLLRLWLLCLRLLWLLGCIAGRRDRRRSGTCVGSGTGRRREGRALRRTTCRRLGRLQRSSRHGAGVGVIYRGAGAAVRAGPRHGHRTGRDAAAATTGQVGQIGPAKLLLLWLLLRLSARGIPQRRGGRRRSGTGSGTGRIGMDRHLPRRRRQAAGDRIPR